MQEAYRPSTPSAVLSGGGGTHPWLGGVPYPWLGGGYPIPVEVLCGATPPPGCGLTTKLKLLPSPILRMRVVNIFEHYPVPVVCMETKFQV